MVKRTRVVSARSGELKACWGRAEPYDSTADLQYAWGGKGSDKSDARILSHALEECKVLNDRSLREELVARGYDITTLKFSISKLNNTSSDG